MNKKYLMSLTAITLSIALVLGAIDLPYLSDCLDLGPVKVSADSTVVEVDKWSDLADAIANAANNDTIRITDNIVIGGDEGPIDINLANKSITLDLNAYTIDRCLIDPVDDGYIFKIISGSFTVTGNSGGSISGGYNKGNGGGIIVESGATFTLDSGIIKSCYSRGSGGAIYSTGTVNIAGGFVMLNSARYYGGGICAEGGTVNLTAGGVMHNTSGVEGCGIYLESDAEITVAYDSVIDVTDNHLTSSEVNINNLYLIPGKKINVITAPHAGTEIGITTMGVPVWGSPITIATGAASDSSSFFKSDIGYDIEWNEGNNTLELTDNEVGTWDEIQTAFNYTGFTEAYVVRLGNNITAGSDDSVLAVSHDVILDLNGYTLDRGLGSGSAVADGSVITVNSGTLTIRDSSANRTGKITGGNSTRYGGGVLVNNGAGLIFESGTISGNNADYGGGVGMQFFSSFVQREGVITLNTASSIGGGVFVDSDSAYTIASGAMVTGNTRGINDSNVFLMGESKINIVSSDFTGAAIGVSASNEGYEITNGFSSVYQAVNFRDVFTADDGRCLSLNANHEVYYNEHTGMTEPTWEWSGYSSARVAYVCAVCGEETDHADAAITGPSYDEATDKVVFTATATLDGNVLTDKKATDPQPELMSQTGPYVNVLTGRYTPGTIAHYELTVEGNTYYFAIDGDHSGELLDDVSLSYLTFDGAVVTGYCGPDRNSVYIPSTTADGDALSVLGSSDAFFGASEVEGPVEIIDRGNIATVNTAAFAGIDDLTLSLYRTAPITINGSFTGNSVIIKCYHDSGLPEGLNETGNYTVQYLDQHTYEVEDTTWADDYSSAVLTLECTECHETQTVAANEITKTLNNDGITFTITASGVNSLDGRTYTAELADVPSYQITLVHKIDTETEYRFRVPRSRVNGQYTDQAKFKFSSLDLSQLEVPAYSEFSGWTNGSTTYDHNYTVTVTSDNTSFTVVWRTIWAEVAEALTPEIIPSPTPDPDPEQDPDPETTPTPTPAPVMEVNIKLYSNLIPSDGDRYLTIPENVKATIDMNGYTIDRGLTSPTLNGYVFRVDGLLIIKNGTVKGGNNTGNGGGFYVTGKLVTMEDTMIRDNHAKNGAGIFFEQGADENHKVVGIMYCGNIEYNSADERGGGVYVSPFASFTVTTIPGDVNTEMPQRRTLRGGGGEGGGPYAIIENNNAGVEGGGVYIDNNSNLGINGAPQIVNNTGANNQYNNVNPPANASAEQIAGMLSWGAFLSGEAFVGFSMKSTMVYALVVFISLAFVAIVVIGYVMLKDRGNKNPGDDQRKQKLCEHPDGHHPGVWDWNDDYTRVQAVLICPLCSNPIDRDSANGSIDLVTHVDPDTNVTTYTASTTDERGNLYTDTKEVDPYIITLVNGDNPSQTQTVLLSHLKDQPASYTFRNDVFVPVDPHNTPDKWVEEDDTTAHQFGETISINRDRTFKLKYTTGFVLSYYPGADDVVGPGPGFGTAEDGESFKLSECYPEYFYRPGYVFDIWSVSPVMQIPTEYNVLKPGEKIEKVHCDWTATALWKTEWSVLNEAFANAYEPCEITRSRTLTAMPEDVNLIMPANRFATLNLAAPEAPNNAMLDRNLYESENYVVNGNALTVLGTLTLINGGIYGGKNLGNGGGIFVANGGTLALSNFTVSANSCSAGHGGGIYVSSGSNVSVSGYLYIMSNKCGNDYENVYLATDTKLGITGDLSATTRIGITMQTPGVFTSGLSTHGNAQNFVSDDPNYVVRINDDGEAYLACKVEFFASQSSLEPADVSYVMPGTEIILPDCTYQAPEDTKFGYWLVKIGDEASVVKAKGDPITVTANTKIVAIWEAVTPEFMDGHALQLNGQIGLQFFVELPSGKTRSDYTDCYVTFEGNKIDSTVQYPLPEDVSNKTTTASYMVQIDLSSIQMAEEITPTLHYTEDGVEKTVTGDSCSIENYITSYVGSHNSDPGTDELKLVKAIADYGHYTQIYMAVQNNWTIGEDYAAMNTYYTDSKDFELDAIRTEAQKCEITRGTSDEITNVTYSLILGSQIGIIVYLTPAEGVTINEVLVDGKTVATRKYNDNYYVVISNILATQLTASHTVEYNGAVTTVSPMSYVYDMLNSQTVNEAGNYMVCALYNYAQLCHSEGN
ncbi:MAG: hypothetical protein K6A80_06450 [Saccharofermentans sp.]|nr:hypothetical protein [Saccharofermentans sp.]